MRLLPLVLLLLASCRTLHGDAEPDTAGWVRHVPSIGMRDIPGYSVALPAAVRRLHAQGIDSEVALFEGEGLRISFDYGMYGGIPTCNPKMRCRAETMTIDGRTAQVIAIEGGSDFEPPYRVAFSVEIPVKPQIFEIGSQFQPGIDLSMHAQCVDARACRRARTIASTIRFGKYDEVTPQPSPPSGS